MIPIGIGLPSIITIPTSPSPIIIVWIVKRVDIYTPE
jgi:hypothetical protein